MRASGPMLLDANQVPFEQPQVEDFAEWVFGPDGLRSLQVLAYHDFSYAKRHVTYYRLEGLGIIYTQRKSIYCRATSPAAVTLGTPGLRYRPMCDVDWDRMDDAEAAELIAMLEAGLEDHFLSPKLRRGRLMAEAWRFGTLDLRAVWNGFLGRQYIDATEVSR